MIIRRGSMMSAIAPAGRVNRKIGSVVAACKSATSKGSRPNVVISQPAAVSYIAMPINPHVLAIQTTRKAGWAKAPSIGAARLSGCCAGRNRIFKLLPRRIPCA